MTVKLGRVALLAGIHAWVARTTPAHPEEPSKRVPILPWFIVGFLVSVVIRSAHLLPTSWYGGAVDLANLLLAAAMFGLGLTIRWTHLWPLAWRPAVLATSATAVALGTSLAMLLLAV